MFSEAARHQVAFNAKFLKSMSPPDGTPLIFSYGFPNQGEAYNSTSGYFVSPYQGLYYVSATTAGFDINQRANFYLYVDSTDVICLGTNYNNGHYVMTTVHAVLYLNAGQRVWIGSDGSTYNTSYGTFFSGFLLSHDFA